MVAFSEQRVQKTCERRRVRYDGRSDEGSIERRGGGSEPLLGKSARVGSTGGQTDYCDGSCEGGEGVYNRFEKKRLCTAKKICGLPAGKTRTFEL